jgi:adenylate cyclase
MYELQFLTGGRAGQIVPVTRSLVAGRSADCSLVVPDANASRHHCALQFDGARIVAEDKGSANGTFVNDTRIEAATALEDGDELCIGQTRLRVRFRSLPMADSAADQTMFALRDERGAPAPNAYDRSPSVDVCAIPRPAANERTLAIRLDAVIRVAKVLAHIRDLDRIARGVLDALFEVFPQADRGFLLLGNDVSNLVSKAMKSRGKVYTEDLVVSKSICRHVLERRRAILFNEMSGRDFTLGESVYSLQIRAAMVIPLMVEDEIIGVLQIDTPVACAAFDESDLELAAAVGQQAAIALHNAALLRRVEEESVSRASLMRFLPTAMVEQVISGQLDVALGGNTCDATILFSDIVGFTRISETLAPESVVALMNAYFSRMVPCIEATSGGIDKFMGDAILAVWGVPLARPDSAVRAATAALAMQNAAVALHPTQLDGRASVLEMGIGINSGPVVAGNIGADSRTSYTVLGDAVNTAQRLEAAAGRGQVLVSNATWDQLGRAGFGVLLPPLHVKNRNQSVDAFSLRGITEDRSEVLLHVPVRVSGRRAWIVRRLADESFILLHPPDVSPSVAPLVTDMPELDAIDMGRANIAEIMPHEGSDGGLVRTQIVLQDATLGGLLGGVALSCERSWVEMPRG